MTLSRPDGRATQVDILENFDPLHAAALLSNAADITLVLTAEGIICERVTSSEDLPPELFIGWPGKALIDTVTVESRAKIEQMLSDAASHLPSRWRQVNHPTRVTDADIPVRYSAMQFGPFGHIVVIGRDLRMVASLQQKLIQAEQSIEQEYARLRYAETRYRILFQVASEAILIVDARSGRVTEVNPAATNMLRKSQKRVVGNLFEDMFGDNHVGQIRSLVSALKGSGRADEMAVRLGDDQQQAILFATLFRQDASVFILVRLTPLAAGANGVVMPRAKSKVVQVIEEMPDGFVVTDLNRSILTANTAFLDIAQLGSEEQALGETIDRWLGRPGVDINQMMNSMKEYGSVRQFMTVVRGQFGTSEDVEVSGVAVPDGKQPCFGFSIRRINRRPVEQSRSDRALSRSVDEMTKLVGKVPLKELVREATDVIEKMCIEAALKLNENNRASTADMLGLSRPSLYSKLHRYGIDDDMK